MQNEKALILLVFAKFLLVNYFHPSALGDSYLGTSIKSKDTFYLQDGGFAFEARLRLVDSNENPLSRGIIAGFFSYTPIIEDGKRDEIDFEILSNFIDDGQNNNTEPSIFTNIFNDDDFNQEGDKKTVNLGEDVSGLKGIDLTAFNKYRIEWDTNEIKWFINDVEIRSEINNIPDRDMSIYLNIWANGFEEAVDESLLPASNPQSNETFYYDVDYLQLERFDEPQQNTIIDIDNFSNNNQINLNGGSTISGNVLRLLPNNSGRGSAFYSSPINIDSNTSFSTSFEIEINRINGGGDGFTFILQNDRRQDNALGDSGGNLGYARINPSLVIQFDVYQNSIDQDPNNNHVGINLNGSKISVVTATPNFDIDNTDNPLNVWIDYQGKSDRLEIFLSETDTKPSTPLLEYEDDDIDLLNLIGEKAYLGFTAGQSSGTSANIDILNWQFSADVNIPPTDISLSKNNLNENLAVGTVVGTFFTESPDGDTTFTYTLVSGDGDSENNAFTIEGNQLKSAESFDFETQDSYSIRVQTDDGNGGTFEKGFTININDVEENNPPTEVILANTVTQLAENTNNENGIQVADLNITDDGIGTNNITIVGTDKDDFEIRNNNQLFFIGNNLDFETKNEYQITVNVDDETVGNTPDLTTNFTLNIIVDEPVLNDPLFRFQNSARPGTYLFVGEGEAQDVRENYSPPFVEEGFAFFVSLEEKDNLIRFNRFQSNLLSGTYIFANEEESESIRANYSEEFTEEGTAFYAYGADANMGQDVFRFRNITNNTYLFALGGEAIDIRQNYAHVFVEEGVAFEVRV